MQLFLSASDSTPMYQQIVDQVTAMVVAGDWAPGASLPSIRDLASANQVSVITVKRAYQELERAGVILTRQGKGSFVAESLDAPRAAMRSELEGLLHQLLAAATRLGLTRRELKRLLDATPDPTDSTNGPDR